MAEYVGNKTLTEFLLDTERRGCYANSFTGEGFPSGRPFLVLAVVGDAELIAEVTRAVQARLEASGSGQCVTRQLPPEEKAPAWARRLAP